MDIQQPYTMVENEKRQALGKKYGVQRGSLREMLRRLHTQVDRAAAATL